MEVSVADGWNAQFIETDVREICKNADEVVRSIKSSFPGETNESLSRKAGVSFSNSKFERFLQTICTWHEICKELETR
jgi:hypothetical protein